MFKHGKGAFLFSGMIFLFVAGGCCCPFCQKATVETTGPIEDVPYTEPAEVEPAYEEPAPAPAPVVEAPQPAPAPLPPAVTQAIQDLSDKYPGLFKLDSSKGLLRFSSDFTFDSGSAVVKADAKEALGKLAAILNEDEARNRSLTIIGHTDSDRVVKRATIDSLKKLGKSADNMGLSEARAEAVAAVLQAGGVDTSRITTTGRGQTEPVAENRTAAGKARNRRVEIYVTPLKSGN